MKSFRNTVTYQKLRGGPRFHPWIWVFVWGLSYYSVKHFAIEIWTWSLSSGLLILFWFNTQFTRFWHTSYEIKSNIGFVIDSWLAALNFPPFLRTFKKHHTILSSKCYTFCSVIWGLINTVTNFIAIFTDFFRSSFSLLRLGHFTYMNIEGKTVNLRVMLWI